MLFVLKIEGIFEMRKSRSEKAEMSSFLYIYNIDKF